jgi:hypothetical protein
MVVLLAFCEYAALTGARETIPQATNESIQRIAGRMGYIIFPFLKLLTFRPEWR